MTINPNDVLPVNANTLARLVFFEDSQGKVRMRVGTIGAGGSLRHTAVTVNATTWTALPTTALANRNTISIQNRASNPDVRINGDNAASGVVGMLITAESERTYQITDDVTLYAKCATSTCVIDIEELA